MWAYGIVVSGLAHFLLYCDCSIRVVVLHYDAVDVTVDGTDNQLLPYIYYLEIQAVKVLKQ